MTKVLKNSTSHHWIYSFIVFLRFELNGKSSSIIFHDLQLIHHFVGFFIFLDLHFYHCLRFFLTSKSPPSLTSFSSIMFPNSQHFQSIFHPIHNFFHLMFPNILGILSTGSQNSVLKHSRPTLKGLLSKLRKPIKFNSKREKMKKRQRFETILELDTL